MDHRPKFKKQNYNTGINLCDTGLKSYFLGKTPKRRNLLKKLNWTFSKLNFCALKDTTKKVERQPTEQDKILINCI